jgi:hypothetical protein
MLAAAVPVAGSAVARAKHPSAAVVSVFNARFTMVSLFDAGDCRAADNRRPGIYYIP